MQPGEGIPGVLHVLDRNAAHHCADRRALDKGDQHGTVGESGVPEPAHARAAIAELECNAAKDQPDKHQQYRQVEGAEEDRIGRRKGREETCADYHQPGLVAVPERRDAGHHLLAFGFVAGGAEKNADADVEAVEEHVDEDGGCDDRGPEQGERARVRHRRSWLRLWLPVALAAVSANASGRLAVAFGIASAAVTGPSRSSL